MIGNHIFYHTYSANTKVHHTVITWIIKRSHRIQPSCQWMAILSGREKYQRRRKLRPWACDFERRNYMCVPFQWWNIFLLQIISENIRIITITLVIICSNTLTLPIASKPLSKNNITPRNMKNTPNPVSPTPISAEHHTHKACKYITLPW